MNWIKDSVLDLIILLVIFSLMIVKNDVLIIVLYIYTALLLFGKILALFMPLLKNKAGKSATPLWFHHMVYFLSVGIFVFVEEYYLAGLWGIIWILSAVSAPKQAVRKQP